LRSHPDHWESTYHLANLSGEEAGTYQETLHTLQSRHRLNQKVDLLLRLAQEAAAARNWSSSLTYLQEALKECGQCESAREVHRGFGMVYCQMGNLEGALKELQLVLELRPNDKTAAELVRRIEGAKTDGCDSRF